MLDEGLLRVFQVTLELLDMGLNLIELGLNGIFLGLEISLHLGHCVELSLGFGNLILQVDVGGLLFQIALGLVKVLLSGLDRLFLSLELIIEAVNGVLQLLNRILTLLSQVVSCLLELVRSVVNPVPRLVDCLAFLRWRSIACVTGRSIEEQRYRRYRRCSGKSWSGEHLGMGHRCSGSHDECADKFHKYNYY